MLTYAAVLPFAKDLTSRATKKDESLLAHAVKATQSLEADFYAAKPDVLVLLDASVTNEVFTINTAPTVAATYDGEEMQLTTDVQLAYHLQEARPEGYAMVLENKPDLPNELSVPLYFLTQHIPNINILTIGLSKKSLSIHASFGEHLHTKIHDANKRIAIVAPSPLCKKKKINEKKEQSLLEVIKHKQAFDLLRLGEEKEFAPYDLRALVVMESLLKTVGHTPNIVFYDPNLGLEYLVTNFSL